MKERGLSIYALYLTTDLCKATVYRWFSGTSVVSVDGAYELLHTLSSDSSSQYLDEAAAVLEREASRIVGAERLLNELKARKLPRRRTLEALRAAGISGFE